jgi:REP element-mobilizing transposase RayT
MYTIYVLKQPEDSWRSRGYLPHFDDNNTCQSVCFFLDTAAPRALLERWRFEKDYLKPDLRHWEFERRLEAELAHSSGEAVLHDPRLAALVKNALLFFDEQRYRLHAWVVMPNHVHVLFEEMQGHTMSEILHSWKSFTAKACNRVLRRTGRFWYPEWYDRYVRNADHYTHIVNYIEMNPVAAGLCERPEDWPWSSARHHRAAE